MYLPNTDITNGLENVINTPIGKAIMVGGLSFFIVYVFQSMVQVIRLRIKMRDDYFAAKTKEDKIRVLESALGKVQDMPFLFPFYKTITTDRLTDRIASLTGVPTTVFMGE